MSFENSNIDCCQNVRIESKSVKAQSCDTKLSLKKKPTDSKMPTFSTKRDSRPNGMRDRAMQMVKHFGGECLSAKKLSIVKGAEAFKFKCTNGHVFYKFVDELQKMTPDLKRKLSKSTAGSDYSQGITSSDEEIFAKDSTQQPIAGCWCPKCENFFKTAQVLAKAGGF